MEEAALAVLAADEEKEKETVPRPPSWGGLLIVHKEIHSSTLELLNEYHDPTRSGCGTTASKLLKVRHFTTRRGKKRGCE